MQKTLYSDHHVGVNRTKGQITESTTRQSTGLRNGVVRRTFREDAVQLVPRTRRLGRRLVRDDRDAGRAATPVILSIYASESMRFAFIATGIHEETIESMRKRKGGVSMSIEDVRIQFRWDRGSLRKLERKQARQ